MMPPDHFTPTPGDDAYGDVRAMVSRLYFRLQHSLDYFSAQSMEDPPEDVAVEIIGFLNNPEFADPKRLPKALEHRMASDTALRELWSQLKTAKREGMKEIECDLRSAIACRHNASKARQRLNWAQKEIEKLMESIHLLLDKFPTMNKNTPPPATGHTGDNINLQDSAGVIGAGSLHQEGVHVKGDGNHIIINQGGAKSPGFEDLLKRFIETAGALAAKMPAGEEKARFEASAAGVQREATSEKPNRKWYEVSMEGVMEAATKLGGAGKQLVEIAKMVAAVMVGKLEA